MECITLRIGCRQAQTAQEQQQEELPPKPLHGGAADEGHHTLAAPKLLRLLLSGHNPKLLQLLLLLFVPILTVSPAVVQFNFIAAPAFELNKDPSPAEAPPRKPMLQGTRKAQTRKIEMTNVHQ